MSTIDQTIAKAEQVLEIFRQLERELRQTIRYTQDRVDRLKADRRANLVELTNAQAAQMLGVTPRTVMRWKAKGKLRSTSLMDVYECLTISRSSQ